jgi:lysophospholipase L1-like esterase
MNREGLTNMKKTTAFILFIILLISILAAFSIYDKSSERKQGEKKIVAFGDSLTYGFGDEKGSGYIDTLDKKLNEQNKEDFDFTNEAIYGLESSGILTQLSDIRVSSKLDEADYFIIFIGTNDLINSNGGNLKNLKTGDIEKGQEIYVQNLKAIIDILKKNNEDAHILVLGLYNPYPDSGKIETIIDDWNKKIIDVIDDENRIAYIPTNDLFKGKAKQEYFSDSLHLNDKGYKLVADRILEKYNFK